MTLTNELIAALKQSASSYQKKALHENIGIVTQVGDGIAIIEGLSTIASSEMIDFGNDLFGVALNLNEDQVGAVLLGDSSGVKRGDEVKATGKILSIPVGESLIGRVVGALGAPKDGGKPIVQKKLYPIEKIAPGVVERKSVDIPLQTGITAIDAMIPIGRGQRELIIGDRQTGKTAVVLDAIVNQK